MLIFAMCPNFFVDLLNEGGGSKRFRTQGSAKNKKCETFWSKFSNKGLNIDICNVS